MRYRVSCRARDKEVIHFVKFIQCTCSTYHMITEYLFGPRGKRNNYISTHSRLDIAIGLKLLLGIVSTASQHSNSELR